MNDSELVYLAVECNNKQAFDYLLEENFDKVLNFCKKFFYTHFYNIDDEFDNAYAFTYEAFIKALKTFNYKTETITFARLFFIILKNKMISGVKKVLNSKNRNVNHYCSSFDVFLEQEKFDFIIDEKSDVEKAFLNNYYIDKVIKKLYEIVDRKPKLKSTYYSIIYKIQGYPLTEISEKLDVSKKFICDKFTKFLVKIKKIGIEEFLTAKSEI